jgi:uncharacterized phage protein (TIGR02216 family)
MKTLDWSALLQLGLHGLRLKPDEFWALTPAELRIMLGEEARGGPLTRTGLDTLMQNYPDAASEEPTHGR